MLVIITLMAGHVLVAIALEVFVLPQHVYQPIKVILDADHAVRIGQREEGVGAWQCESRLMKFGLIIAVSESINQGSADQ